MYNIPILFLIFNRPDITAQVFERIREIKPAKLYVAADGAREGKPGEDKRCSEARAIIKGIDWPCELKTLYRDKNLGCKIAVSEAISWFFEQEEYGVILEDDCLPDISFFPYCEDLLIRYKDDTRIGHISGNCFLSGIIEKSLSYDFCSISHSWGWATWRRVWQNFDLNFSYWNIYKNNPDKINNLFNSLREKIYFSTFISDSLAGRKKLSVWDVQYLFMLRSQHQLSIYPIVNLVTNIGLNLAEATHTKKNNDKHSISLSPMPFPLKHPQYVLRNKKIDDITIKKLFFSWKRLVRYFLKLY